MSTKKGFTLIELIVVLIIIGILVAIFLPNYYIYLEQGKAQAAANNLMVIVNAEKNYFFNNGNYYYTASSTADTLGELDTMLALNISDSNYWYWCTNGTNPISCSAERNNGTSFTDYPGNPNPLPTLIQYRATKLGPMPNPWCSQGPPGSIYCPSGTTL